MTIVITDKDAYIEANIERGKLKRERESTIAGFDQQIKLLDEAVHIPIDLFFMYCRDIKSDVTVKAKVRSSSKSFSPQYYAIDPVSLFGINPKPVGNPNFCPVEDDWGLLWLRDVTDNKGTIQVTDINEEYVEIQSQWDGANKIISFRIPTILLMGKDDGYADFHETITSIEMEMEEWKIVGLTVENAELTYLETLMKKYPKFAKENFSNSGDCK